MTTYYVSAAGSDAANGTSQATPWATIGKVNSTVFAAGDVVLLRGGDNFAGTQLYIDTSDGGTPASPLTIGSYGTGKATITNTGGSAIYVDSRAGIVVQDLILVGNPTTPIASDGLIFYKGIAGQVSFVRITNVEASGFKNGISLGGAAGGGYADVVIDGCLVHDNRDQGLIVYGPAWTGPTYANANITITGTKGYNNKGNSANTTTNSGSGIVLGSTNGGLIELCTAYGNGNLCTAPEGPAGIWAFDSTNIVIQRCVAYSNRTGGTADGDGFDLDIHTSNSVVQQCLAYDNDGAGILLWGDAAGTTHSGNTVRHNLCWGNCRKGVFYGELMLGQVCINDAVYGNTLVQRDNGATKPPCLAIALLAGSAGNTVRNNILMVQTTSNVVTCSTFQFPSVVLLQGNRYHAGTTLAFLWGSSFSTLAAFRAGVLQELLNTLPVGSSGDPLLVAAATSPAVTDPTVLTAAAGLKPAAASPVLGAGLDLAARFGIDMGARDYFGARLVQPLALGGAQVRDRPTTEKLARISAPPPGGFSTSTEFAAVGHTHPELGLIVPRTAGMLSAAGVWDQQVYGDLHSNGHRDNTSGTWAFAATLRTLVVLLGLVPAGGYSGFRIHRTTAMVGGGVSAALFAAQLRTWTSWARLGAGNVAPTLTATGLLDVALPFTLADDQFVALQIVLTGTAPTTYPVLAASPAAPIPLINAGAGSVVAGASTGTTAPAATLNPTTGFTTQTQKPWAAMY